MMENPQAGVIDIILNGSSLVKNDFVFDGLLALLALVGGTR